jgi:hypothetical protein
MACSDCLKTLMFFYYLLTDMGLKPITPMVLTGDNTGAIDMATNMISNARTKHIDIRHHYIRECFQNKLIDLKHCDSLDNKSNILTKPLPRVRHEIESEALTGVAP